jgi:hypothetical protein
MISNLSQFQKNSPIWVRFYRSLVLTNAKGTTELSGEISGIFKFLDEDNYIHITLYLEEDEVGVKLPAESHGWSIQKRYLEDCLERDYQIALCDRNELVLSASFVEKGKLRFENISLPQYCFLNDENFVPGDKITFKKVSASEQHYTVAGQLLIQNSTIETVNSPFSLEKLFTQDDLLSWEMH